MRNRKFTTETSRSREDRSPKSLRLRLKASPAYFLLFQLLTLCLCAPVVTLLSACSHKPDPNRLVMIIESSPLNLDPRVGVDGQSQRIDELLFDPLLRHDDKFELQPALAERWEIPDSLTYVFHLRHGVRFHNGQPLTSRDVKWTFDSLINGKIRSPKASTFASVSRIETPDDYTVIFHLKQPYASLMWNLSGAAGIVPYGSGEDFNHSLIGSGPFRFISAQQDRNVIVERNPDYWAVPPKLPRVEFKVIPDATTRALELRKQSADVAINSLVPDTVVTLERDHDLTVMQAPGTIYTYVALNQRDPILKDVRVRQAIAYALNVEPIIHYLLRDEARPAYSILPPQHWAYNGDVDRYSHDPEKARQLLALAGYAAKNGVRFHITMKTSTEESTRSLAAVFQQQLREVGIALDIRSFESATFLADVTKGAYQVHALRWIGGNQDPDMFENVFATSSFAPKRANRTFYSNPRVDELIKEGRSTLDQAKRKAIYDEIQQIVAQDLPYINLWYLDNVLVHTNRVHGIELSPAGNYDFLRTAELVQ
jgi:peptide/nickel transport system substrate-binding protein